MLQSIRVPGRVRPTGREVFRAAAGRRLDWFLPDNKYEKGKDQPGILVCPSCHAISVQKRWFLDENRYRELRNAPGVRLVTCPGCQRIERHIYEGDVRLQSPLLLLNKPQALGLIYHEEEKARLTNPISRLASVEDRGDEIVVLTTTRWLAERIGKAFRKTFKGTLDLQRMPYEKFVRVRWCRDAA